MIKIFCNQRQKNHNNKVILEMNNLIKMNVIPYLINNIKFIK